MPDTIFWSWQSDLASKSNRNFIKDCLEKAIEHINSANDLDERPEIDHDTKGMPGLASIPDVILAKIDQCTAFVADITPIACSAQGKFVANPNVLIELGYAKKSIGPERIILVWNKHYAGCSPEKLPFDLRHRRAPISYELDPNASSEDRSKQKKALVNMLVTAIEPIIESKPADAPASIPIPVMAAERSTWFDKGQIQRVNAGTSYGADSLTVVSAPHFFARIVPTAWPDEELEVVSDNQHFLLPLGDTSGMSWGQTTGGKIAYCVLDRDGPNAKIRTATKWFRSNGEIWGFENRLTFSREGNQHIADQYALQCWNRFLVRHQRTLGHWKAKPPYRLIFGTSDLSGTYWPKDRFDTSLFPNIEERVFVDQTLAIIYFT